MNLMDAHRIALRVGNDWVTRAIGVADAALRAEPGDPVAGALKGALLTMVEDEMLPHERRDAYRRCGISMMDDATAKTLTFPTRTAAVLYVAGVGNAMLPRRFGRDGVALRYFQRLGEDEGFGGMMPDMRLRALALKACLERAAGDDEAARRSFEAARAISLPDAAQVVAQWEERG